MSKEIPMVFHNSYNEDYKFIIKKLAEEFEGTFKYLRENMKSYIHFSFC